ncbi:hypothetical protein HRI_000063700 [Hibiscus trionum]|uniref:DUF4218 domain-containing protein n=1 Tax=Hibiscus trionum TaxID=183268 RepID=A0A9W7GS80_HIBTR|nr:hypothetical protein HRI_000063700 [Hibiscus trionum]
MMHLLIHLANEAKIAGPVTYRWMYPVERYLSVLKSFVRNRAHPKGSIAEGENPYLGSETTIFSTSGRPLGRKKQSVFHVKKHKRVSRLVLDEQGLAQAHRYVLFNSDEVSPYIKKQEQEIKRRNRRKRFSPFEIQKLQSETFHTWFRDHVALLDQQVHSSVVDVVKWLARGNNLIDDPFVLASQVKKVYFVKDETQPGWQIVKHAKLRDVFDMGDASCFNKDEELEQLISDDSTDTSVASWIRNDDANGLDVSPDMENENIEEYPINEENGEDMF